MVLATDLGDIQVIEDVLVGRLPGICSVRGGEKRIGIDRFDCRMIGQHLIDPWVVTAAVVDHQGGVG